MIVPIEVVRPENGRLIVRRVAEKKAVTQGGLFIPDASQVVSPYCEIIAIADPTPGSPGVGDYVIVPLYAGTELEVGEEKFIFIKPDEYIGSVSSADLEEMASQVAEGPETVEATEADGE